MQMFKILTCTPPPPSPGGRGWPQAEQISPSPLWFCPLSLAEPIGGQGIGWKNKQTNKKNRQQSTWGSVCSGVQQLVSSVGGGLKTRLLGLL